MPDEALAEPNSQVFIQSLQGLSVCFDSEILREMFANLITTSCLNAQKEFVHPSFPSIIKQLTPYECRLLNFFSQSSPTGIIFEETLKEEDYQGRGELVYSEPIESLLIAYNIEEKPNLNMVSSALDNLTRLRLINMHAEVYPEYVEERAHEFEILPPDVQNSYIVKIEFTILGLQFAECCIGRTE